MPMWDIKGRDAFSATAYGGTVAGGTWDQGGWSVNVAGSGAAKQSATTMPADAAPLLPWWAMAGLAVGGAWLLLRRR